jgi:hypothetical protein
MRLLPRHRRAAALAALAIGVAASGCRSSDVQTPAPSAAPAPARVDSLGPGELVEGSERAFGVLLPRDLKIVSAFADVVYARGAPGTQAVTDYLLAHTEGGSQHKENGGVRFDHVTAAGSTGPLLQITVSSTSKGTEVVLRDQTPPPLPPGYEDMSVAEKWRTVGLTPDGKILDWKHLN